MPYLKPERCLMNLRNSTALVRVTLAAIDRSRITLARDGADGWNTLEIMCHMEDLEAVYEERIRLTLAEDHALFPRFDHVAAVTAHHYADQDFDAVVSRFFERRAAKMNFLRALSPDQWERVGVHAEFGELSVAMQATTIALHDVNHLEQIARVMGLPGV